MSQFGNYRNPLSSHFDKNSVKTTKEVSRAHGGKSRNFYAPDFTWNQFWRIWKCKICHFSTFRGSEFWFFTFLALFGDWNLSQPQNSEPLKIAKKAVLGLLNSQNLISRKIRALEKSRNFYTVEFKEIYSHPTHCGFYEIFVSRLFEKIPWKQFP